VVAEDSPPAPLPLAICPQPRSPQLFTLDLTQDSEEAEVDAEAQVEDPEEPALFDLSRPSPSEEELDSDCSDDPQPPLGLRERLTASADTDPTATQCLPLAKRKFVEVERRRSPPAEGQENADPSPPLSQPTTEREKRRVHALRAALPSTTTQTFSLCRSHSAGPIALVPAAREETSLSQVALCSTVDEWEVVLLIDRREKDHSFFESHFSQRGVRNEVSPPSFPLSPSLSAHHLVSSASSPSETISGWRRGRPRP
jgi:hypothetical protein